MYRYIKGKLGDVTMSATWRDGAISGDPALVRKIFEVAWETPEVEVPPPGRLIKTEISNPRCFIPLATKVLDKVIETASDEIFEPGAVY